MGERRLAMHQARSRSLTSRARAWSRAWRRVGGRRTLMPASRRALSIAQLITVSYLAAIAAISPRLTATHPQIRNAPAGRVSHGREFAWCHVSTFSPAPPGTTRHDLAGFSQNIRIALYII